MKILRIDVYLTDIKYYEAKIEEIFQESGLARIKISQRFLNYDTVFALSGNAGYKSA